jgi:hypothetical protein
MGKGSRRRGLTPGVGGVIVSRHERKGLGMGPQAAMQGQTLAGPDLQTVREWFSDPHKRRFMAEGYREQAEFDRELAERDLVATVEVLPPE